MAVGVVLGGLLLSQGHPSPLRPCLAACGVTPQAPAPAPWFGGHGWTLKQHVALPACAVHSTTGLDTNQPQDPEVGPTAFYPPPNIALEAWRATHVVLGTSYARRQVQRAAGDVASAALRHAALPANGSAGQDARPSPPEQFPPLDTAALGRSLSAAVSPAVVASHLASAGRVADAATTTAMLERVATPVAAAAKASAGPCFPVARTARDGANQSTAVLPFLRIPPAAAAGDSGTLCFVGLSRAALARAQRGIRGAVAKEAALAADGAGLTLPDTTGATSPFSAFAAAAGDGAVPWADANTLALAPAGSAAAMACLLGAVGRVLGSLAALWTASAAFTRAEARWPRLRSLLPLPLPPAARAMQALSRVQGAGSDHHLAYERVLVTAASTARARQEELERRAGSCRAEARTLVQQARSARCKHDGSAAALLHRAQRAAAQSRELASAAGSVDVPALPFAEDMPRAFVRHVVYGAVASSVVPAAADAVARLVPAFA